MEFEAYKKINDTQIACFFLYSSAIQQAFPFNLTAYIMIKHVEKRAESALYVHFDSFQKMYHKIPYIYAIIDFSAEAKTSILFPSIGYIVINYFIGDAFDAHFLNIESPDNIQQQLYITGLFADRPALYQVSGHSVGYSMKIHPEVGYYLLKESMCSISNGQFLLSEILGKEGKYLRRLQDDHHLNILENNKLEHFFQSLIPDRSVYLNDPIYHAVNMIILKKGNIKVKALANHFCMCERTFNRQFMLKVGTSPKTYAKIWQWQYVTELLKKMPHLSLQELSFKAGYYDGAHLARAFKENILQTPIQFQKEKNSLVENYLNFPESNH